MAELECPFCRCRNAEGAIVCASCSRDIAVPQPLLDELHSLRRKRDGLLAQVHDARGKLDKRAKRGVE
jgi:hypothetical protein